MERVKIKWTYSMSEEFLRRSAVENVSERNKNPNWTKASGNPVKLE